LSTRKEKRKFIQQIQGKKASEQEKTNDRKNIQDLPKWIISIAIPWHQCGQPFNCFSFCNLRDFILRSTEVVVIP
jgi:hypothetical protein